MKNQDGTASEDENNLVTLEDEIAKVDGKYELGNWIYFDATMSKMYTETNAAHGSIPKEGDIVYCLLSTDKSGSDTVLREMTRVQDRGTWRDVWKVDVPEKYKYVKFANYEIGPGNGAYFNGTDMWEIQWNKFDDPCFYADTGDDVMHTDGVWRGGYWDEVYTIRDPEKIKETPVVDIKQEEHTRNSKRLYVKTTLYDYYTDYELNGNNRKNLSGFENMSTRDWVPFRAFNQALSEYYEEAGESIPIYTGHFQPHGQGGAFDGTIAEKLGLYGYGDYTRFFSTNNSQMDINGAVIDTKEGYARVAQGLVANELINGQIYTSGGQATLPYFDEEFLNGDNSKNAVLGRVYENVSFPFELKEDYYSDEKGVSYWVYDSDDKSLEMKQSASGEYYLAEHSAKQSWSENRDSKGDGTKGYGFFPFNASSSNGARSYNYGFGAKLEIKFRLTEDGKVEMETEETEETEEGQPERKADIKFDFSGDDDVWVFIDGHLALDMGGAHGASHGYLNFANRKAYVDNVKASAGGSGSTESDFYIEGFENGKYDTREHTLTMFYMERGMWESNMKISFNFPDENQLEVEKQVNTEAVNEIFKSSFDGHKIFEFSIRNLATHFGKTDVRTEEGDDNNIPEPIAFNHDFSGIWATSSANTFRVEDRGGEHSTAAYWFAKEYDTGGQYTHLRYGVIPGSAAAAGRKYLQFSYFYAGTGNPSLSNMRLRIETDSGYGEHRLSGKVHGSASMKSGVWSTITVDLDKFFAGDTVNRNGITSISFAYDYPQPFYLDDFTFIGEASSTKLTGFITKQPDIPDYETAEDSQLKTPIGAVYTRKLEGTKDSYGRIDKTGIFALENGESVLFRDQFRRGSYIELMEQLDSPVFTTTWTMYENDQPVIGMVSDGTVGVADTERSLMNQSNENNAVEDGRTEKVLNESNDGDPRNAYSVEQRPNNNVFVFRSYADPDTDAGVTKLKVVYTNTVNVGDLIISKSEAAGSQPLTGKYKFRVTFTNIAGMGLEGDTPIVVNFELSAGGPSKSIKGIPLGTEYVIEELEPADKSFVADITGPAPSDDFVYDIENGQVRGKVMDKDEVVSYDFSNMLKPVISIEVTKVWKNAAGNKIMEDPDYPENSILPESLTVRIQRKVKGDEDADWETVEKYKDDIKLGTGYERSWKYTFSDLEKYVDNTDPDSAMYEYRIVEVDEQGEIVLNGGSLGNFQASYDKEHWVISGRSEDIPDEDEDELYPSTITNVHTVSLKVKKVDANGRPLGGVTFRLEKKNGDTWETVKVIKTNAVTESATEEDSLTTQSEEDNPYGGAGIIIFSNLPRGEYRLIETETAPGHTLLASPIPIAVNKDGDFKYTINGIEKTPNNNMLEITIMNGQQLVMPSTGGAGPIPFTVGGLSICMIASLMYIDSMRKRRKEGKAS